MSSPSTRSRLEYDPNEFVEEEEEIASDEEVPLDTTHLSIPSPSANFEQTQHTRHGSRRRRWLRGAGPISLSIDLPTPEERPDELEMFEEPDEEMADREVKKGKKTNELQRERRETGRESSGDRERSGERTQRDRNRELKMDVQEDDGELMEQPDIGERLGETEERGFREVFISLNGPGVGIAASTNQNSVQRAAPQLNGGPNREVFISTDSRKVPRVRQQERYNQLLAHYTRSGNTDEYLVEDVPLQQLHATGNGVASSNGNPLTPLQNGSPSSARQSYSPQSNGQQRPLQRQQSQRQSPEVIRNRVHQTAQSPTPPEPAKKRHTTQSPRSRRMIECVLTQNDEDGTGDDAEVPVALPTSGRNYPHLEAALSHITRPLLATHKEVNFTTIQYSTVY